MKFKTKISKTSNGNHYIRDYSILDLIQNHSFSEVIFLLFRGSLPEPKEKRLLECVLVAAVEHGIEAPSIFVPRTVASSGNSFNTALASGVLAIGENHGGAVETSAEILQSKMSAKEIVGDFAEAGKKIAGFGHKIYKEEDPRATVLYKKARELGLSCTYFSKAYEIEEELEKKKGKKIPLNIDGAMAAAISELNFDWKLGKAFFIISRLVGMSAHVLEEMEQSGSYHRLESEDIEFLAS